MLAAHGVGYAYMQKMYGGFCLYSYPTVQLYIHLRAHLFPILSLLFLVHAFPFCSAEPGKMSKSAIKNLKKKQNRAAAAAAGAQNGSGEGGSGGQEGEGAPAAEDKSGAAVEAATKAMSAASVGGEVAGGEFGALL